MPPSKQPRKKATSKNPIQAVLEQARAIDRRRQLQIANQAASIDRLLKALVSGSATSLDPMTGHPLTPQPVHTYAGEMEILHGALAQFRFENEMMVNAIRQLVEAIDGTPLDGVAWPQKSGRMKLAEALAAARALITTVQPGTDGVDPLRVISDAQGSSGDQAG